MKKFINKLPACSNCGYEFKDEDNYCPSCGQKNNELKIPFRHLMIEFAENALDLDSKAFITIKNLLFKPGFLSLEFKHGKRVKYLPPIRLYFIISFIFFLLLNFFSGLNGVKPSTGNKKVKINTVVSYRNITTLELTGLTRP